MSVPARRARPSKDRTRSQRLPFLLVALLAVEAVGVITIWVSSLRAGAFSDGVFAYQLEGSIPAFHLVAEFGMATALLVGVAGWFAGARGSSSILTFAAGMLTYGSVNALGWAVHNDVVLTIPMGIALVSAAWLMVVRLRGERLERG